MRLGSQNSGRCVTVLLAFLAASAPGAAANVGPSPPICSYEQPTNCIAKGGGANTTVSQKLIKKGDTFSITLTPNDGYGGVASYDTQPTVSPVNKGTAPVLKLLRCEGGKIKKVPEEPYNVPYKMQGPRTCRYKVLRGGKRWQKAHWGYNVRYGGLAAYSEDSLIGIGKDESYVEGFVRGRPRNAGDDQGPGAKGVKVVASNKDNRFSDTTDSNGFYAIEIAKPGGYDVFPKRRGSDLDLKPVPDFTPGERRLRLSGDETVDNVNFKLERGDTYKIRFRAGGDGIEQVIPNGATKVTVAIKVLDLNDDPVANKQLFLKVNENSLSPKGVLCKAASSRIWPGPAEAGVRRPAVDQTQPVTTDGGGEALLDLWPGTEKGTFSLSVRAKFAPAYEKFETEKLKFAVGTPTDLAGPMRAAIANVPNAPRPENNAAQDPQTANSENVTWLASAFGEGKLAGWTYLPVRLEDGSKFGLIFYTVGSPPAVDPDGTVRSGSVFNEGGGRGLKPIADGEPLEGLGAWSGGKRAFVRREYGGYPWADLIYLGYPLELGPAQACIGAGS